MRIAVVLSLLAAPAFGQSFDYRHATDVPAVLAALRSLALNPDAQFMDVEVAAFLMREADGRIGCLLWPSNQPFSASYRGALPDGIVAMAHTHPAWVPQPSSLDVLEAKRSRLPSYVVTPLNLYVIDPSSGESIRLIRQRHWTHPTSTQCECRTTWPAQRAKASAR